MAGLFRMMFAGLLTVALLGSQSAPVADAEAATKSKSSRSKSSAERRSKIEKPPIDSARGKRKQARAPQQALPDTRKSAPAAQPPRHTPEKARPAKEDLGLNAPKGNAAPPAKTALAEPATIDAPDWTDQDVIAALTECVEVLAPLGADVKVSRPLRDGLCGAPAPVLLKRIGGVELTPPAVVTCPIVGALHRWVRDTLEPASRDILGSAPRRIVSLSGYSCRNRIGTINEKISEHARANAIDIAAVVTQDGQSIDVVSGWGETLRDARRTAESAQDARAAGGGAGALDGQVPARQSNGGRGDGGKAAPPHGSAATRVADASRTPRAVVPDSGAGQRAKRAFLQRLHEGACGTFTTVLGPEANEAHRNHLHFDLERRKRGAFCE